jgi:hypothetical protein
MTHDKARIAEFLPKMWPLWGQKGVSVPEPVTFDSTEADLLSENMDTKHLYSEEKHDE